MASHGLCETIVRFPSEFHSFCCIELFGSRRRERKHLHVDAGSVHFGDALLSEIAQLLEEFRRSTAMSLGLLFQLASRAREKGLGGEMFFEGYGSHCGLNRDGSTTMTVCGQSDGYL